MSDVGFYRYKIGTVLNEVMTVKFNVNYTLAKTCTITPISLCEGKLVLKYLNKNGQYRYFPFSKYYEEKETPKEIGKISSIITSILSSKSETRSIGYKSERTIELISEPIPTDQLNLLRDIYTSPRVYLKISSSGTDENDWVLVTVKADKSIRKEIKNLFSTIRLEITLPESVSITMI